MARVAPAFPVLLDAAQGPGRLPASSRYASGLREATLSASADNVLGRSYCAWSWLRSKSPGYFPAAFRERVAIAATIAAAKSSLDSAARVAAALRIASALPWWPRSIASIFLPVSTGSGLK